MKHIIVEIPDEKYSLFIELLTHLSFVKDIEVESSSSHEARKVNRTPVKEINENNDLKRKAIGLDRFLSGL